MPDLIAKSPLAGRAALTLAAGALAAGAALGAIAAVQEAGLLVPADVSVVGYDDSRLIAFTDPPLTTVRQPIAAAGIEIVDALLETMGGKQVPARTLPIELVVRASSRACLILDRPCTEVRTVGNKPVRHGTASRSDA